MIAAAGQYKTFDPFRIMHNNRAWVLAVSISPVNIPPDGPISTNVKYLVSMADDWMVTDMFRVESDRVSISGLKTTILRSAS